MTTLFVTGTDTEIGKTFVTCLLLAGARRSNLRWAGFKPIAAGASRTADGLRNEDALALQAAAGTDLDYDALNPCCLETAVAPHLAAEEQGVALDWSVIQAAHRRIANTHDVILAEGAGGWQVPFDSQSSVADLVALEGWPVLLVVGMRLGCINHALLSAESIAHRCRLIGWVANCLPPEQPKLVENIESLRLRMPAPLLGIVRPNVSTAGELLANLRAELADPI